MNITVNGILNLGFRLTAHGCYHYTNNDIFVCVSQERRPYHIRKIWIASFVYAMSDIEGDLVEIKTIDDLRKILKTSSNEKLN